MLLVGRDGGRWRLHNSWGRLSKGEEPRTSSVVDGDDDECDDVVATDEWFRTHVFHAVVHTDLVKLPHGSEVSTRLPPWDVLSTVSR